MRGIGHCSECFRFCGADHPFSPRYRCKSCGKYVHTPKVICPFCLSFDLYYDDVRGTVTVVEENADAAGVQVTNWASHLPAQATPLELILRMSVLLDWKVMVAVIAEPEAFWALAEKETMLPA